MVGFQRSIGREKDAFRGDNGCYRARLLVPLHNRIHGREIARGTENSTFVTVIARQDPQTIPPLVVNNVVNMPNGTPGECIDHAPGRPSIGRRVDMNFIACRIIKVLPPVNHSARNSSDVQGTSTASNCTASATKKLHGCSAERSKRQKSLWPRTQLKISINRKRGNAPLDLGTREARLA